MAGLGPPSGADRGETAHNEIGAADPVFAERASAHAAYRDLSTRSGRSPNPKFTPKIPTTTFRCRIPASL